MTLLVIRLWTYYLVNYYILCIIKTLFMYFSRIDLDNLVEAQETPTRDLVQGLEYYLQELDVTLLSPDIPPLITDDQGRLTSIIMFYYTLPAFQ